MPIIIGAAKKSAQLPLFGAEEIVMLQAQADALVAQGMAMDLPATLRVVDLLRLSKTLTAFQQALLQSHQASAHVIDACMPGNWKDEDHWEEAWNSLQASQEEIMRLLGLRKDA